MSLPDLPTVHHDNANLALARMGRVGIDIVMSTLDELDSDEQYEPAPRGIRLYDGDIVVRHLTFQCPDAETRVLDGVTLTIARNRTTAFPGSSGAGKTTLVGLVLGLLEPTSGAIECGGRSILDDWAGWYSGLGVVPQDVFLLNDTAVANIAFGVAPRPDRPRPGAEAPGDGAPGPPGRREPEGIDTAVGGRGVRLSRGQRQRLGIARALYRDRRCSCWMGRPRRWTTSPSTRSPRR